MSISAGLRYIFWMRPEFAESKMNPKSHIFHDNQWFIYRSDEYNFACKAGHNDEPHNHNDVGSFIVSKNDKVTFGDPGTGEYTRQYFSKERYDLIACSSRGHSVPIINGCYQSTGKNPSVIYEEEENKYSFSVQNAYKIDTLKSLKRSFTCMPEGVDMVDEYEFTETPSSIVERFVSLVPIEITDGGIVCGDSTLVYDKSILDASLSSEPIMRHGHIEETVYIVDLTLKNPEKSFKLEFKIV